MVRVLLINPWIHDFAAYDFWIKPLGLLKLASFLRLSGIHVDFIDCLDPFHPSLANKQIQRRNHGAGKFHKEEIPKPSFLSWFPRRYGRYGIPLYAFYAELKNVMTPDAILITSGMTYWYPGVQETIAHCKEVFPDVPVILGGIYATLCQDHAHKHSGADLVVPGSDWHTIIESLSTYLPLSQSRMERNILPAWDLMPKTQGVAVKTSEGCPFHCMYCASKQLAPVYRARNPRDVVHEILWSLRNTAAHDVAFYDDALLCEDDSRLVVILDLLKETGVPVRFHDPNGLHARYLTRELAKRMYEERFSTIRIGLESADPMFHEAMGRKLHPEEFRAAVDALQSAGYAWNQIGAYVMVGLPGQTHQGVKDTIDYVLSVGARPYLAEYSPIPGTLLWESAAKASPFPLEEEPLFQNNTLMPCRWSGFAYEDLLRLKASLRKEILHRLGLE